MLTHTNIWFQKFNIFFYFLGVALRKCIRTLIIVNFFFNLVHQPFSEIIVFLILFTNMFMIYIKKTITLLVLANADIAKV